eukprot:CAMPEP_0198152894 /NCGR_PEP_ID=MMETSP1443-20131203/61601_1 /TAXON_ID=186043 /ORGANISM="Entomoneis sp., Strain CCMP2396" /LENGTH=471 /DNA_ID=CAMNT_0043819035 /DNA_START=11 /DNA_END=1426 /DNA_ORIENTATION=+
MTFAWQRRVECGGGLDYCFYGFFHLLALLIINITTVHGLATTTTTQSQLVSELQACFTPQQVLDRVGRNVAQLAAVDCDDNSVLFSSAGANVARLALVRLSKQLIALDNQHHQVDHNLSPSTSTSPDFSWWQDDDHNSKVGYDSACEIMDSIVHILLQESSISTTTVEAAAQKRRKKEAPPSPFENLVEGTKAFSVIARLVPEFASARETMYSFWARQSEYIVPNFAEHEISGVYWAMENILCAMDERQEKSDPAATIPKPIESAWRDLDLPFHIVPACLSHVTSLSVNNLRNEVDFRVDEIRTASNKFVKERRQTAWEGNDGVGPFLYSNKEMPRQEWSPTVCKVRDLLADPQLGHDQYYDSCLLNFYPDGGSGMRYHIDPDQGVLWDYDTAVVSVGASRRFAFRNILVDDGDCGETSKKHHTFVSMHGDLIYMFGPCQEQYQHCVKKAETKGDDASRASLVFKRSWSKK